MKLTREQVLQLSDIELNRAMVWFYPVDGMILHKRGTYEGCDYFHHRQGIGYSWLNYLKDYNLTMPLATANLICLETFDGSSWWANKTINPNSDNYKYIESDEVELPLRAICEVLLIIAMEREA